MIHLLKKAAEQLELGRRVAFVTMAATRGSAPQVPGAKLLVVESGDDHEVYGTIGGGKLEFVAITEALSAIRERKTLLVEKDLSKDLGMACGGRVSYLIEPQLPPDTVIVCGGGHIGFALGRILDTLGLALSVVDSRPEYANLERFPNAHKIVNSHEHDVLEQQIRTDENSLIVIVSRDHPTDFALCRYFLKRPWKYLGVIASKTKAAKLRKELLAEGYDPVQVERISSPIGLPIGGSTPEEIAISVAAEIVQVRNRKS